MAMEGRGGSEIFGILSLFLQQVETNTHFQIDVYYQHLILCFDVVKCMFLFYVFKSYTEDLENYSNIWWELSNQNLFLVMECSTITKTL